MNRKFRIVARIGLLSDYRLPASHSFNLMLSFLAATTEKKPTFPLIPALVQENYALLPLRGELDETHLDLLNRSVDPLLQNPEIKKLILDCTQLTFINSKIIGFLVGLHTHLSKEGRHLIIANPQQTVMDVIQLVGLTAIIPVLTSVQEAITL